MERIKEDGLEQFIRRMEMRKTSCSVGRKGRIRKIYKINMRRFAEQLNIIRESIKVNFIDSDRLFHLKNRRGQEK